MRSGARFVTFVSWVIFGTALAASLVAAAEEPAAGPSTGPSSVPEGKAKAEAVRKTKSTAGETKARGRRPREKEAEGSEAADRFEANTVIKSRYQLDGESLEVDPD